MSALVLAPVLPLVLVAVALAVATSLASRRPSTGRLRSVRRLTAAWRRGGLATGALLAVALLVAASGDGRTLAVAAPLVALGALFGIVTGEVRTTAPSAAGRRALVEVRRVADDTPRLPARAGGSATLVLAGLLLATSSAGSTDVPGRSGAVLAGVCDDGSTVTVGPWAGAHSTVAIAVVVGLGLVTAAAALVLVVRRPRQGEDRLLDDGLRRSTARAVVAATGMLVGVPLLGVATLTATRLTAIGCPPTWSSVAAVTLLVTAGAALVLSLWSLGTLAAPDRPHDADVVVPDDAGSGVR